MTGYLSELRDLLGGSAAEGRDALRALLGESRLMVGPDPEHGFKIEGTVWLDPRAGVQDSVVAGAGFDTGEIKIPLSWAACGLAGVEATLRPPGSCRPRSAPFLTRALTNSDECRGT